MLGFIFNYIKIIYHNIYDEFPSLHIYYKFGDTKSQEKCRIKVQIILKKFLHEKMLSVK